MSRPIQSQAPAFLNLLGLKNRGALPADLVDSVAPTVEMLEFYLQGAAQNRIDYLASPYPVAAFTGGFITSVTVPNDEYWYVHQLTTKVRWIALPNNQRSIINLSAGIVFAVPGAQMIGPAAAPLLTLDPHNTFDWAAPALRDVWVTPGSNLGLYASWLDVSDLTPAQVWGMETHLRYTPVKA